MTSPLDKAVFVSALRAAQVSDAQMEAFHRAYEQTHPEQHQALLELLGMDAPAIARVRQRSRQ